MTMTAPARARSVRIDGTSRTGTPRLDWLLMLAVTGLLVVGTVLVWSATVNREDLTGGDSSAYLKKQLVNIAIGIVLGVMIMATDHRWVRILAPLVYVGSVVGLVLVLVMGSTVNGSRSWLMVGGLSIQPAEFAKLAVVIGMALLVAERTEGSWKQREVRHLDVLGMLGIAGLPAALILLQPDLGTMLVLSATVFGVVAISGAPRRWLVALAGSAVGGAVLAVQAGVLKDYQVDRFLAFTNPGLDPRGAGYNTEQARIAIGNGGMFGQGLFDGSQTKSGFVPEQHTDFIFTAVGEELGFVGAASLLALFALMMWRTWRTALMARDHFGTLLCVGVMAMLVFQVFENVGMTMGITPIAGIPLPFVSYGGSATVASFIAIGLVLNVHMRRYN